MEWRSLPFYSFGGRGPGEGCGRGFFFFLKLCLVESGLSTVHFSLGYLTVDFLCGLLFFFFLFFGWGRGVKAKSSQVPGMFPQRDPSSTSLLSHMLWQMLSCFLLINWAKGEELYTSKWSFSSRGVIVVFFLWSDGPIKLAHYKKMKIKIELGRHLM